MPPGGGKDVGHRAEVAPYVELRVHREQKRLRLHGVAGRGRTFDRPAVRDDAAHADARCPVRAEQEIHGQAVDRRSGPRPAARGPLNEVADAVHHGHLVHELDRLRDSRPAAHDEAVTGVSEQLRPVALSGLNGPVTLAPARGRDHPIRTGCPGQIEPALHRLLGQHHRSGRVGAGAVPELTESDDRDGPKLGVHQQRLLGTGQVRSGSNGDNPGRVGMVTGVGQGVGGGVG